MKIVNAYIITMVGHGMSEGQARRGYQSIIQTGSALQPVFFPATTPVTLKEDALKLALQVQEHVPEFNTDSLIYQKETSTITDRWRINYTYPRIPGSSNRKAVINTVAGRTQRGDGFYDPATDLVLKPYAGLWKVTASCSLSHFRSWLQCIKLNEPIVVMEHDAMFVKNFNVSMIQEEPSNNQLAGSKEEVDPTRLISLNSPISKNGVVTRRGKLYHEKIQNKLKIVKIANPPSINNDDERYPQGLPGNSCYYITPWAAKELFKKISEIGIWPNDALICKEFFPWVKVSTVYYTDIQKSAYSTTVIRDKAYYPGGGVAGPIV